MNTQETLKENESIEKCIKDVITEMTTTPPGDKEYAILTAQLNALLKAKETDTSTKTKLIDAHNKTAESALNRRIKEAEAELKEAEAEGKKAEDELNRRIKEAEAKIKEEEFRTRNRPKPETLALIGANLASIILIIRHEETNMITTKAFGLLNKLLK